MGDTFFNPVWKCILALLAVESLCPGAVGLLMSQVCAAWRGARRAPRAPRAPREWAATDATLAVT